MYLGILTSVTDLEMYSYQKEKDALRLNQNSFMCILLVPHLSCNLYVLPQAVNKSCYD